jgi:hypothetical protein
MHTVILNPNDEMISIQEGNIYILKENGSVLHCEELGYRGYGCNTWKVSKQTHEQIKEEKLQYENANNYGWGIIGVFIFLVFFLVLVKLFWDGMISN